jgi:YD repeat-containing protein
LSDFRIRGIKEMVVPLLANRRVLLRIVLTSLFLSLGTKAALADDPPPRSDTVSATGVSMRSGAFNYQISDLSAGAGAFPEGLTFERSYQSGLSGSFSDGLSQGWTHNFAIRINNSVVPPLSDSFPPRPGNEKYLYTVVIGSRSIGFFGGSVSPTGGAVGTYAPVLPSNQTLVFSGSQKTGQYTFTDSDGTIIVFNPGSWSAQRLTAPDGTTLDFTYDASVLSTVVSSRGYTLILEHGAGGLSKACIVNNAQILIATPGQCPAGAPATTYTYSLSASGSGLQVLTASTDSMGRTTSYAYVGADHLGCVTLPGSSLCQINNVYNICHRKVGLTQDPPHMRYGDQVISQTTARGESFTYSFEASPECPGRAYQSPTITRSSSLGTTQQVNTSVSGLPGSITDELGRVRSFITPPFGVIFARISAAIEPEGNEVDYGYDSHGNIITTTRKAKPGSGLADVVSAASFPATCVSPKTCSKPTTVTDANGNVTSYTYDAAHGGVLTETRPAAGGVNPVIRHAYAQRHAWIMASGGGYVQVGSPVWLVTEDRICQTSETVSGACSAGASDEVVTTYDYGPDSGPNNLLLRGKVVTSGGVSLRTCYGYDVQGNKISETSPRAGLTSCP